MTLQEVRTIILPLAMIRSACKIVRTYITMDPSEHGGGESSDVLEALESAIDPDHPSEQWAKIAAALELSDDRPTLDAVIEAVEGLAGKGESDLRLDLACALDELERHNETATEATTRAWIAQARARLNGEPWHPGTQAVKPTTRLMDALAITRDERSVLVDEADRVRVALAGSRELIKRLREAIQDATGLRRGAGTDECVLALNGVNVPELRAEITIMRSDGAACPNVFAFASSATVTEVFNVGDQFKVEVLTWVSKCEDWQPEIGTKVDAGGVYEVIAPGTAVRIHDVGPIPF